MRDYFAAMMNGPGTARFIVQPVLALIIGVLHGLRDHRQGRPPFLAGLSRAPGGGWSHFATALRGIALPLAIAVLASGAFQYVIRSRIRVGYVLLYAVLFVALPYFVSRGLSNRLAPEPRLP